jgi:hypothetical protein
MKLVFFKVSLRNLIAEVKESFKLNEEKTLVSNHIVLLKDFVNHVLKTDGVIYSSECEAVKTYFIEIFHHFFFLVAAVLVV